MTSRTSAGVLTIALLVTVAAPAKAQLETQVLPDTGAGGDGFGHAVSLDQGRALVGAVFADDDTGKAYVLEEQGGAWVQVAELVASDGSAGDFFGASVSLSGTRALVGAPDHAGVGPFSGAAYLYEEQGGAWVQVAKITASDAAANDFFGTSVSLSGNRAIIGSPQDDDNGSESGSAYLYEEQGGALVEVDKVVGIGGKHHDFFGHAVALDGDFALVGAYNDRPAGAAITNGAAYTYERQGSDWVQTQKILAIDVSDSDQFGWSVALEGSRALIGARFDDDSPPAAGSAYVFELQGGTWIQTAELLPADGAITDVFGTSVALSGDRALVGSPGDDDGGVTSGSAYEFRLSGGSWVQLAKLTASDAMAGAGFGFSVSLDDADRGLVGASGANTDAGNNAGAAYVLDFACAGELAAYCTGKPSSEACVPYVACSGGPPSAAAAGPFVIEGRDAINQKPGLLFYGTTGRASLPFQGGTLCVQPPLQRTPPQSSGGNPPPNDCSGVFTFDFNAWLAAGTDPALAPGVSVNAQYWFRDPQDAQGVGLTNGLELAIE